MPIEIRYVDDGLGTLITGTGIMTGDEYLMAFRRHWSQPKENRMKYLYSLSDFTAVTKIEHTREGMTSFVDMCRGASTVSYGNLIAVAAGKDIASGLSRVWEILRNETDWELRIFRHTEKAKRWIKERLQDKWNITDLRFD